MSADARGNLHQPRGTQDAGQSTRKPHPVPEAELALEYDPEVVRSRRALIAAIEGLGEHREALTVLGAHAVIEMTQGNANTPPDDSTRDGDLGVTPSLLLPAPLLAEVMTGLGYERDPSQRPGIWSPVDQRDLDPHARDTIDLIAPLEVAYEVGTRRPRRGARVGDHGDGSVSAAVGTELSTVDREWCYMRSFDDGPGVEVFVAGKAALLCAKAYKVHDRMNAMEFERNPDRLRPKDFADMYRLILASEPEEVAGIFARGIATEHIGPPVAVGQQHLVELLTDAEYFASQVADAWQDPSREQEFVETTASWRSAFEEAAARIAG